MASVAPYRLVGRVKNNRLWEAVRARFPEVTTQASAARALLLTPTSFNNLLNMQVWPQRRDGKWWPSAQRISLVLGIDEEVLFDHALYGKPPARVDVPLGIRELPEVTPMIQLSPSQTYERVEAKRDIKAQLDTLKPREAQAVRLRFGLGGSSELGYAEIGKVMGVTGPRVQQIVNKALRKLRHPSRRHSLREHDDNFLAQSTCRAVDAIEGEVVPVEFPEDIG